MARSNHADDLQTAVTRSDRHCDQPYMGSALMWVVAETELVRVAPWGPVLVLFDDIGIDLPPAPVAAVLDGPALVDKAENFLRSLGLVVSDLDRGEFTILTWSSEFLLQELVDLMFLGAGVARRSLKRIHCDLPESDAALLDSITRAEPKRESIIESHLSIAREFLPRARTLINSVGASWPFELEAATSAYWESRLGLALPPSRPPLQGGDEVGGCGPINSGSERPRDLVRRR